MSNSSGVLIRVSPSPYQHFSPSSTVSSVSYKVPSVLPKSVRKPNTNLQSRRWQDVPLLLKKQALPTLTTLFPSPYEASSSLCCSEMQWQCVTGAECKSSWDTSQTCSMVGEPCRLGREAIQNGRTYTRVHSSSCNTGIVHNSGPFHICNFDC